MIRTFLNICKLQMTLPLALKLKAQTQTISCFCTQPISCFCTQQNNKQNMKPNKKQQLNSQQQNPNKQNQISQNRQTQHKQHSNQSQNNNHSSSQHLKQKAKKLHQKMNRIKQSKQIEEIQDLNQNIQLTQAKFNPLTAYLWIYRKSFVGLVISVLIIFFIYKFVNFSGVYEDPLTKKKKWIIINQKKQSALGDYILGIFKKEKDFMNLSSQSTINRRLNQSSEKLNQNLKQLTKTYLNSNKQVQNFKIHIIDEENCIGTILPDNNIIISKKLLNCSQISEQNVACLFFLLYVMFLRKYHIKDLGIGQISYFRSSLMTINSIKLSKVYTRNYSNKQIDETVKLLQQRFNGLQNESSVPARFNASQLTDSLIILGKLSKKDEIKASLYYRISLSGYDLIQQKQQYKRTAN